MTARRSREGGVAPVIRLESRKLPAGCSQWNPTAPGRSRLSVAETELRVFQSVRCHFRRRSHRRRARTLRCASRTTCERLFPRTARERLPRGRAPSFELTKFSRRARCDPAHRAEKRRIYPHLEYGHARPPARSCTDSEVSERTNLSLRL